MISNRFEHLLQLVALRIEQKTTKFRNLSLTLRYLATGKSQQSLNLSYRVGKATVSKIVSETTLAISNSLRDPFMKVPSSKEEWPNILVGFEKNCIGLYWIYRWQAYPNRMPKNDRNLLLQL